MMKILGQAGRVLVLFSIMTGLIYPLAITGLAQLLFPWRANGSLLFNQGQCIGSEWIGQYFTGDNYFWGRPSATAIFPYNAFASGGSNWGPTNPVYLKIIENRIVTLGFSKRSIPVDLVTASSSGLDPHISLDSAHYQIERISKARHISVDKIQQLIHQYTQYHVLGIETPVVNVLKLNLALDRTVPV